MRDLKRIIDNFKSRHHYTTIQPLAALIDMDGTLYDSMQGHADSWKQLCDEHGWPAERDEFFLYEGMTGAQIITLMMERAVKRTPSPEECKEIYKRKAELFSALPPVPPMPGAQQLTALLKEVGIKRVLVTGSGQNSLLNRLDTDFPGIFSDDMKISSRDVTHGKPHPEPYIRAMQLASVRPSQSIAIENAPLGVKSAATAGAFTVGVVTGPVPASKLEAAGAAIVYDSMPECAEDFPNLLYNMLTCQ